MKLFACFPVIGPTGRLIQCVLCVCTVTSSQKPWRRFTHTCRWTSIPGFRFSHNQCSQFILVHLLKFLSRKRMDSICINLKHNSVSVIRIIWQIFLGPVSWSFWPKSTIYYLVSSTDLTFYQQVKLVNFIRREIHQCRCYACQEKFSSKAHVLHHIEEAGHIMALPERSTWDQPQWVSFHQSIKPMILKNRR